MNGTFSPQFPYAPLPPHPHTHTHTPIAFSSPRRMSYFSEALLDLFARLAFHGKKGCSILVHRVGRTCDNRLTNSSALAFVLRDTRRSWNPSFAPARGLLAFLADFARIPFLFVQ